MLLRVLKKNNNLIEFLLQCESFRSFEHTKNDLFSRSGQSCHHSSSCLPNLLVGWWQCRHTQTYPWSASFLWSWNAQRAEQSWYKTGSLAFLLARLDSLDSLKQDVASLKNNVASLKNNVASLKHDVALLVQNTAHDWERHCRYTATEMFGRTYAVPSVIKSIPGLCKRFVEATEPSEETAELENFSNKVVDQLIARACLFEFFHSRVVLPNRLPEFFIFYFQEVPIQYCRDLLQRIHNADNVDTDALSAKIANNQLNGKELAGELGRLSGQLSNSDRKTDLVDLKVCNVWPPSYGVTFLCSSSIFFVCMHSYYRLISLTASRIWRPANQWDFAFWHLAQVERGKMSLTLTCKGPFELFRTILQLKWLKSRPALAVFFLSFLSSIARCSFSFSFCFTLHFFYFHLAISTAIAQLKYRLKIFRYVGDILYPKPNFRLIGRCFCRQKRTSNAFSPTITSDSEDADLQFSIFVHCV